MILRDDLSEEDLAKLAEKGTFEEKRAVARHPNTSLQTLLLLSQDGFVEDVNLPALKDGASQSAYAP